MRGRVLGQMLLFGRGYGTSVEDLLRKQMGELILKHYFKIEARDKEIRELSRELADTRATVKEMLDLLNRSGDLSKDTVLAEKIAAILRAHQAEEQTGVKSMLNV